MEKSDISCNCLKTNYVCMQNGFEPLDIPALIENRVLDFAEGLQPGENINITRDTFGESKAV